MGGWNADSEAASLSNLEIPEPHDTLMSDLDGKQKARFC